MKIEIWQFFEYLSFILSLVYYKRLKEYSLQLMVPFLFYICCSESLAAYRVDLGMPTSRGFVNIYYVVSAGVFYILFERMIKPQKGFAILYKSIAIVSMLSFLYDLFTTDIYILHSYTLIFSFIQHIFLSLILLFKLSFNEESKISVVHEPYFWIGVGVLLFSIVVVVIVGLQSFIYDNKINIGGKSAYRIILPFACTVLYSCYCYAFYLTSKTKNNLQLAAATTL